MSARSKPLLKLDDMIAAGRIAADGEKTELGRRMDAAVSIKRSGLVSNVSAPATEPPAEASARSDIREVLVDLPLELIDDSPHQRHRTVDEGDIEKLAESIRIAGQAEPIKVRPSPDNPGRYETMAGHRRRRALTLLGRATVLAIVEVRDALEAKRAFLITNEARRDLSDWERAQQYREALENEPKLAATQRELARLLARSESSVSKCLGMLRLPEPARLRLAENPRFLSAEVSVAASQLLKAHPDAVEDVVAEIEAMFQSFGTEGYRGDDQAFRAAVAARIERRHRRPPRRADKAIIAGSDGRPMLTAQVRANGVFIASPAGTDLERVREHLIEPLRELVRLIETEQPAKPARGSSRT